MRALLSMGVATALLVAGCASRVAWSSLAEPSSGRAAEQLARARAAKDALAKALMAELSKELTERGAASAIDVCATRAPQIASEVGREHGLRIGRTSWKLRNASNRAPSWAEAAVAERASAARYFASDSGELGVLLPIAMQSACLGCHGAPAALGDGVADALALRYPDDRATGFALGEVRGWFWIEVP
ncbi:MAG: DUF3365 domain-containing protein [Planctomycetes bacterium]|nr:DUF3365 domain-containing protein [Planctomycetota bacterium]